MILINKLKYQFSVGDAKLAPPAIQVRESVFRIGFINNRDSRDLADYPKKQVFPVLFCEILPGSRVYSVL
jgi:hypothetical protein